MGDIACMERITLARSLARRIASRNENIPVVSQGRGSGGGEERLHFSLTANRTPIYGRAQASLPSPDANIQKSFPLSFASFKPSFKGVCFNRAELQILP